MAALKKKLKTAKLNNHQLKLVVVEFCGQFTHAILQQYYAVYT